MEDFVTYELAVKLKEKGFDNECHAYYEPIKHCLNLSRVFKTNSLAENYNCVTAPTISQVLKWLRKYHATHIEISLGRNGWYFEIIQYEYYEEEKEYDCKLITISTLNDSYESTALAGIEYVLDNLI